MFVLVSKFLHINDIFILTDVCLLYCLRISPSQLQVANTHGGYLGTLATVYT